MLGIMEDLPTPHQALPGGGELPTKNKPLKVKKTSNNGSTITDFFKSPPKQAVPKPVNLFGYFQQKSSPNSDQQLSRKPTDHVKKIDITEKTTGPGKETSKVSKGHGKEQKVTKKKSKSDLKVRDELGAANDNKEFLGGSDVESSQKKKINKERSSKGKRKKAASPGSSTDDFESPPVKAKRPKVTNNKKCVTKKVFSLSSGDGDSSLIEASYDVARLDDEDEVKGVSLGGEVREESFGIDEKNLSGEESEVVKEGDALKQSSLERNQGDGTAKFDVKTFGIDKNMEQNVEVISYQDFLNSGMEDLEEGETEKNENESGGSTADGTAGSVDSDVVVLESAGEDGVMILTPGKAGEGGSGKDEILPGIGKEEPDEDDITGDIRPLDEEGRTSDDGVGDSKNEAGHDKDEKTKQIQDGQEDVCDVTESKEDTSVTETPSKSSSIVLSQSPRVVTVEAIIHSPQSGQKSRAVMIKEANCSAKGRVSNVALDDTDNDISIIEVVNSPVKPLYGIFLKKSKKAKTSGGAEETRESKDACEDSDAFDETPAKKKETKKEIVRKERPRRTPKRKSTTEKEIVKEPLPVKTSTPRSSRKVKTKGKEIFGGKKEGDVIHRSGEGNRDAPDGSNQVRGRTLRSRRSTAKMKEVSPAEDNTDKGEGRKVKNILVDTADGKEKKLTREPKKLRASSNASKNIYKNNNQSAKAQLLLKKAKGQKMPASQSQRLQERTRKPTLRFKLDPQDVSAKPVKVIDLDQERQKDHMGGEESNTKRKIIKGSGSKAPVKLAPMFTKEGLKSLAKKQQQNTEEVVEIHTLSSDDEYPKSNQSVVPVASPFTALVSSKKWKEKTKTEQLPEPLFPEISHVQQQENFQTGLDFWNLPQIDLSKLNILKKFQSESIPLVLEGFKKPLGQITMSHLQGFVMPQIKFEKHPELTHESQKAALEVISKCNPKFPVRRIFKRYLAKRKGEKPEESKKKGEQARNDKLEQTGRKRKHEHQNDGSERKVQRRSLRGRSVKEQSKVPDTNATASDKNEETASGSPRPKDLLWSDKYQPTSSEEVLGNTASVKKLASWLSEWKTKIHRLKKKEAKAHQGFPGESKEDSESDFEPSDEGGSDSEDDGDGLCNTILITGPHGVGKTSIVYACAKEMGFKVIEINASSKRVGRQILDDLGEATQSHQLTGQAGVKSANLAQFFKVRSPSAASGKPQPKPTKPKIHKAFAAFVKAGAKKSAGNENMKSPQQKKNSPQKAASKKQVKETIPTKDKASPKKVQGGAKKTAAKMKSPANERRTSQLTAAPDKSKSGVSGASLILFDEVDIVFEEDKGFLNAVNTFMAGTKRPIILTTSDTHFGDHLEGKFEHIVLRRPDTPRLATSMQLLCLAENVNTNYQDMVNLVSYYGNDVRQCLHNLQFWLNSGAMLSSWQHKDEVLPSRKVCKLSLKRLKEGEGYSCSLKSEDTIEESNKVSDFGQTEQTVLPTLHKECFQSMLGCDTFEQLDGLFKRESAPSGDVSSYTLIRKFMRDGAEHVRRLEEDILHKIIEDCPMEVRSHGTVKAESTECRSDKTRIKELCGTSLDHLDSYLDNLCNLDILEQKTNFQRGGMTQKDDCCWWGVEVSAALSDISDHRMSNWREEELDADMRSVLEWENFSKCRKNLAKVGKEWKKEFSQEESSNTGTDRIRVDEEMKPPPLSENLRVDVSLSNDITSLYGVISRKLPRWTRCRPHVVSLDYLPSIRLMCRSEQLREAAHLKRRFLHYFDSISFNLKTTDQVQLASITENFTKPVVRREIPKPTVNDSDSD